jgi:Fe-S cluster biogenesis protein NfuA
MGATADIQQRIGRIEELVQKIESTADPALRATAKELVQSVMDLHGAGIERMLEILSNAGDAGASMLHSFAADELVSSLLVLYDVHPEDFDTRVNRGIEKARRLLKRRSADLHVVAIEQGAVHLQINTNGHSCGSSAHEFEKIIREALFETAPDALEVRVDGAPEPAASGFVPLASLSKS